MAAESLNTLRVVSAERVQIEKFTASLFFGIILL